MDEEVNEYVLQWFSCIERMENSRIEKNGIIEKFLCGQANYLPDIKGKFLKTFVFFVF